MTINVYTKGKLVRCSATFRNEAGAVTDPTTVTFSFRKPDGTTTPYVYGTNAELVKDSTGNYHVDLTADQAAEWYYRWQGTGAVATAEETQFVVQPSAF